MSEERCAQQPPAGIAAAIYAAAGHPITERPKEGVCGLASALELHIYLRDTAPPGGAVEVWGGRPRLVHPKYDDGSSVAIRRTHEAVARLLAHAWLDLQGYQWWRDLGAADKARLVRDVGDHLTVPGPALDGRELSVSGIGDVFVVPELLAARRLAEASGRPRTRALKGGRRSARVIDIAAERARRGAQ